MTDPKGDGAPPRHVHVEKAGSKINWLPWLALLAGILALLFALSRCELEDKPETAPSAPVENVSEPARSVAPTAAAPAAIAPAALSGLGGYLAGAEAAPRTFAFERLNFDTAASEVRAADRSEIESTIATLNQYPNVGVQVVGYADSRGSDPANTQLGKARAEAVKAALVAGGIQADRVETASGGESDPVDTNATATGQAENRRTKLVVTRR